MAYGVMHQMNSELESWDITSANVEFAKTTISQVE